MNSVTLVDTDILIDAGRGVNDAVEYVYRKNRPSALAVSAVTQMELIVGCRSQAELRKLEKFLNPFVAVKVSHSISDKAVELLRRYRLSHGLLIPDGLIAATALVLAIPLVTNNQRDFRFIKGLKLVRYPRYDDGCMATPFLLPELIDGTSLVAIGGDLRPERLLHAYRHGIFPWYDEGDPILWWSPDPRAIFELDGLHVSRRLRRTVRSGRFTVTVNRDFAGVIRGCADRAEGTWITPDMMRAYETLHRLGHAHSVEVWHDDQLAGGLYGVALGGFFAGESMFTRVRDASKVALVHTVERLRTRGFTLFDTQFLTEHTEGFGAVEIPRAEYLERLQAALQWPVSFAVSSPGGA